MKNLFLSAIFATVAFVYNAQTKIINVYEVSTFSKDTLTNSFDVFYNPDIIGDTLTVSKRFIINFIDSTFIEYDNGYIVSEGKIDIITNLIQSTNTFLIVFIDNNRVRGINSFMNNCLYFEQTDTNSTIVNQFENYSMF
jgi:hypothetical protein